VKRALLPFALALAALFALTACGQAPSSAPPHFSEGSSAPEPSPDSVAQDEDGWQRAYLAELNTLCTQYGKFVQKEAWDSIDGVKYAHLLDFDGDGQKELVVLFDHTVRLYTYRDGAAVLLHEDEVGGRYGQTDVSYTFHINARASQPCLVIYHSEHEWTEEAIRVITVSGGAARVSELFAATDGENEWPDRAWLTSFAIDGQTVSEAEYEAARSAVLDGSLEIDADWGAYPVSESHLDILLSALSSDEQAGYVLPHSDAVFLSPEDLEGLSPEELRLARNEISPRHGRTFTSEDLNTYFISQSWYRAIYSPEEFDALAPELLNQYEVANLALILEAEGASPEETLQTLSEEEARAIAAKYWDYADGQDVVDEETGYPIALFSDGPQASHGRSCYAFSLKWLVDNSHWSTLDVLYVDAETGEVITPTEP